MKKIILFIVFFVYLIQCGWAQDEKPFIKVPNDEWPSQVIFDTVQVCYQGTLRWVAMGNPNLMNTPPPYHIARIMTIHCFCVLDKLRTQYKLTPWTELLSKDNPLAPKVAPREFMIKAIMCIKDHNTLDGLVVLEGIEESLKDLLKQQSDNETTIIGGYKLSKDKKQIEGPDNGSGESDSIPEQPNEPIEEVPQINF